MSVDPILHATAVDINGSAVLIKGCSGAGKSSLALQLLALGGKLIADDRVVLRQEGDQVIASKPDTLPPLIEARGIGLIATPRSHQAPVRLVVDMDKEEKTRLPAPQEMNLLEQKITVWGKSDVVHFPATIFLYLSHIDLQQKA